MVKTKKTERHETKKGKELLEAAEAGLMAGREFIMMVRMGEIDLTNTKVSDSRYNQLIAQCNCPLLNIYG